MVELHGWITIRDTYKVTEEDNTREIADEINRVIDELGYPDLKAKWMNGACCFQCSFYTNHWDGRIQDIINLYNLVAEKAIVYFLGLRLILNKAYPFLLVFTLYVLPLTLILTITPAPTAFPLSPYARTL